MCLLAYVHFGLACLTVLYGCRVNSGYSNPTYLCEEKKATLGGGWSLMFLKCSSGVFVYPQGFIYSRGPDTLGRWKGVKMTRAGARRCAALPVPALEAHGGSAGALGHHIDLALTDTCREREV